VVRRQTVNGVPEAVPVDPAAVEDAWVVLRLVPG
jgi:hypothetical protein